MAVAAASETTTGVLPGLVWAFRIHADGVAEELPPDKPIDDRHDGWLWLHFNLADARVPPLLRSLPFLPANAAAMLTAADAHQHLHGDEDCVYGVFADMLRDLGGMTHEVGFLRFAMTERYLVSARRGALTAVEAARQTLRGGYRVASAPALLRTIVEHIVESVDHFTDELFAELDSIEEAVVGTRLVDERRRLAQLRRTAVRLHRQLAAMRTLFHRLERSPSEATCDALRLDTHLLVQRLDGLDHEIVALRDRAHLLQEEIAAKLAEETNRNLRMLSFVTMLLMPATLVAGIFGMNMEDLPLVRTDGGFAIAILLAVGASAVAWWLLRRLGVVNR